MKRLLTCSIALALLAGLALAEEDAASLAPRVKDYPAKFRLIAMGRDAVLPLLAQVGSEDRWLDFESRSALRWIATHARGRADEAEAVARDLGAFCGTGSSQSGAVRAFVAELLGELATSGAVEPLAICLADDEPVARAAVDSLRRSPVPAATTALLEHLPHANEALRPVLLGALGARGDERALPALLAAARAGEGAAVDALGAGGFAMAEETLAGLCARRAPGAFAALLAIARSQADTAMLARLMGHAQDDEQRRAVIRAATRLPVAEESLVQVLAAALERPALKPDAQAALLGVCEGFDGRTAGLLCRTVLESPADEGVLLRALAGVGRAGDEEALPLVLRHVAAPRASVRTTALTALAGIPGKRASDALLAAFRDAQDPAVQSLLLRLIRERGLVEAMEPLAAWMPSAPADLRAQAGDVLEALAALSGGEAARRTHLRLLGLGVREAALRGLASSGDAEAVPAIVASLGAATEGERALGAEALTAIGERLARAGARDGALVAFRAALDAGAAVENRLRLLGEAIEITAREGRISAWWVVGPFPAPDEAAWSADEIAPDGVDPAVPVAALGAPLAWRPVQAGGRDAVVELDPLFSPNDRVTAYAFAEIHVKAERDAVLLLGSDDGLRCWLNGKEVHRKLAYRGLTVDEDRVAVHLVEGRNALLLKVCEGQGDWGFCARLEDDRGRPLKFKIR